ncbi:MAG: hypothetical protein HC869_24435 [Rhodospirillales bacterium]|nr:hypothetical protein [Rhodospirillales bacterium]
MSVPATVSPVTFEMTILLAALFAALKLAEGVERPLIVIFTDGDDRFSGSTAIQCWNGEEVRGADLCGNHAFGRGIDGNEGRSGHQENMSGRLVRRPLLRLGS